MREANEIDCEECSGAGGTCSKCGETPDNCDCPDCDCEVDAWAECPACRGRGVVESEEEEAEEE